jgi:hypothetical protein
MLKKALFNFNDGVPLNLKMKYPQFNVKERLID